jgi:hypothetical protein
MVSLFDDGDLAITLGTAEVGLPTNRWRITFKRCAGYQNILEEYRLQLWQHLDETHQRCGNTFIVCDSPWIATLAADEALLEDRRPTLIHYVIATSDDVIDVLSSDPPEIIELEAAPAGTTVKGKSTTLFYPRDKVRIDSLFDEITRRNELNKD